MKTSNNVRRGVTLIELLVVIAIISILIGLLLPAVQLSREAARKTQCQNNLKQIGLALLNYESAHRSFPAGAYLNPISRKAETSWFPGMLPYLEQSALALKYNFNKPFATQTNVIEVKLEVMTCPSDVSPSHKNLLNGIRASVHSYFPSSGVSQDLVNLLVNEKLAGNFEYRTAFWNDPKGKWVSARSADFTDGLSNSILLGEVNGLGFKGRRHGGSHEDPITYYLSGSSYDPASVFVIHGVRLGDGESPGLFAGLTNGGGGDAEYYSEHTDGAINLLFADGSVRALSGDDTPIVVFVQLTSINDGR